MYTAPTTKTNILFICISILLITTACLQTAMQVPQSAPKAESTPVQTAYGAEPESGAVFELDPATPESARQCATVTAENALHLRTEPSEDATVISYLPARTIVIVVGKVGEWWKIESAVGTGYAKADYLQESECR